MVNFGSEMLVNFDRNIQFAMGCLSQVFGYGKKVAEADISKRLAENKKYA